MKTESLIFGVISLLGFLLAVAVLGLLFTAVGNDLIDEAQRWARRLRYGADQSPVPLVYEACRTLWKLATDF
jgi:hypothetical protein